MDWSAVFSDRDISWSDSLFGNNTTISRHDVLLGNHAAGYHGNIFTAIWNFVSYIVDKMSKEYRFNLDYYVLIYANG